MLLANPADIIAQLGFDSMTDINLATSMAMDAAEAYLSAQLNTSFLLSSYVDTFFVPAPRYQDGPAVSTEFRLSQGLLISTSSIYTAPTVAGLATGTEISANFTWNGNDGDKGVIRDLTTRYVRQFVQITYTAGFAVDPDNPNSYLISSVPDWLQNACKLKTLVGLVDSPVLSEAQIKLDSKLLGLQLVQLLSRKLRYAPLSILPL